MQAHTQSMVNVDLDLGCMYELTDGTKGVVQPLGGFLGELNGAPYVKLSGDDRFGSGSGETIFVNLDHRERDQAAPGLRLHLRPDPGLRPYARRS